MNQPAITFPEPDEVDELLHTCSRLAVVADNEDDEEVTGVYDRAFFQSALHPVPRRKSTELRLEDARVGLSLFLSEATAALVQGRNDMTENQRIHLERITEFVQALTDRFDRIR